MTVRPRAATLPRAVNLAALATDAGDAALRALLDFEISFGMHSSADAWAITHSTLPWREGQAVAPFASLR